MGVGHPVPDGNAWLVAVPILESNRAKEVVDGPTVEAEERTVLQQKTLERIPITAVVVQLVHQHTTGARKRFTRAADADKERNDPKRDYRIDGTHPVFFRSG